MIMHTDDWGGGAPVSLKGFQEKGEHKILFFFFLIQRETRVAPFCIYARYRFATKRLVVGGVMLS